MPTGPMQWIEQARRGVRKARQQWNAADLKRIADSRNLLEQSVTALKIAIDLLRNGDSSTTNELRPAIASLRRDISTMIRLVDACSAFHRGMSLAPGWDCLPPMMLPGRRSKSRTFWRLPVS